MNRLLSCLAVLLAMLLCAVPAGATGCKAVAVIKKEVVVAQAVAVPVIAPVVATYVPVPLYGAAYTPGPAYSAPHPQSGSQREQGDDLAGAVRSLADEVRRLTEQIRRDRPGLPPDRPVPPMDKPEDPFAPQKADPVLQTFQSRCASCHEAQRAKTQGGGFVLLEGTKGRELSGEDLGKIIEAVSSGRMPKAGRMSEAERLSLIAALVKK